MTNNVASDVMAIVDRQKAEAAAERRVLNRIAQLSPQRQYSKRALSLMTIGRGAMIADLASKNAR